MVKSKQISANRIAEVGQRLYDEKLRSKLEPRYSGKVVTIEVESGDHFMGDTLHEAIRQARKKYPESVFYSVKVGYPAVYSFASRVPISATGLW